MLRHYFFLTFQIVILSDIKCEVMWDLSFSDLKKKRILTRKKMMASITVNPTWFLLMQTGNNKKRD